MAIAHWLMTPAILLAGFLVLVTGTDGNGQEGDAAREYDALTTIEQTRGGRHWADAPTDRPKTPRESLEAFEIEPSARIELVAAEPMVLDPVAIAFDARGRMFVAEYADYPTGPPHSDDRPLSRVVMLSDRDGDGQMDERTLFADHLHFAHSLMPYRDGLLVAAQTELIHLLDTNGDDVADKRTVLFDGFTPAHAQMQIGCPRWGIDNWVYANYGPGHVGPPGSPHVDLPRSEFRFHPATGAFGPAAGRGQYGNTIDRWGRRFFCTNRNPVITAPITYPLLQRNRYAAIATEQYDVAPSGWDSRLFPAVPMKSNHLSHAGTHTSACGVTSYTGHLFDEVDASYAESLFVCEPIGHLVTRSIVTEGDGPRWKADRALLGVEFLTSRDTWFRPASLTTGPDGALYLADMYRLWVEHPKFLPPAISERLDWRAGSDRGRIWRIVPSQSSAALGSTDMPDGPTDHVAWLEHRNGWQRFMAQQLLVESAAVDATARVRSYCGFEQATTRLHALWTLDGLGTLTRHDVIERLDDPHPHVRAAAVTLSRQFLNGEDDKSWLDHLELRINDPHPNVRFQLVLTLGECRDQRATELLVDLALRDGRHPTFADAILTTAEERSGALCVGLTEQWSRRGDTDATADDDASLLRRLATTTGARADRMEIEQLLRAIAVRSGSSSWWQASLLVGLAAGLDRAERPDTQGGLEAFLRNPTPAMRNTAQDVERLFVEAERVAFSNAPLADRVAAVHLIAARGDDTWIAVIERLMNQDEGIAVQRACLQALTTSGDSARVTEILLAQWPGLGPDLRSDVLRQLLRRDTSTLRLLQAMQDGLIHRAILDVDQRVALLRNKNSDIRQRAERMLGRSISSNRQEVATRYQAALDLSGSSEKGAQVFARVCAKCHRVRGEGHAVGPDISDVRNRSRAALLLDILDPNQRLDAPYTEYTIVTDDGLITNGLIAGESEKNVVVRQVEGKEIVIPRHRIQTMQSANRSLMPEGVEVEIDVQQMADLLAFLHKGTP